MPETRNIIAYLTFAGNCVEAMHFYKDCLGGELYFQTIGDSPMAEKMPEHMKENILHASLTNKDMVLMASDMVDKKGKITGNAVSLMLNCSSEEDIRNCYKKLSTNATANHPLEESFWGALFGDLTDKYGNHWILNYTRTIKK